MSSTLENAHIDLKARTACIIFQPQIRGHVIFVREGLDWQLSSLKQFCTSCLPFLSNLKDLYIVETKRLQKYWKDNIENREWLELLHSFTAVKTLYLSKELAPLIGPALQELVEGRTTELLPTLENIFLEGLESSGHVQKGIGKFVAARQVFSSHPVTNNFSLGICGAGLGLGIRLKTGLGIRSGLLVGCRECPRVLCHNFFMPSTYHIIFLCSRCFWVSVLFGLLNLIGYLVYVETIPGFH